MKRFAMFFSLIVLLYGPAVFGQANTIDWRNGKPGVLVVTNAPSYTEFTNKLELAKIALTNNNGGVVFGEVSADAYTLNGVRITEWPTGGVGGGIEVEADPIAGPRLEKLEGRTNDWNAAYIWGNHASAGYLKTYVETDPVAGPRLDLLEGRTADWDAAYGWGPHALAGYLTAEADTLASACARGGFTGTESIYLSNVGAQYGTFGVVNTNVHTIASIPGGTLTCNPSSGDMTSYSVQYFKVYAFRYVPNDPSERMVFSTTPYSSSHFPIGVTQPYSYTLKWGPIAGADGYKIYVPGGSPYFGGKAKFVGATETNLTFTSATTGFYTMAETQPEVSPFTLISTNAVGLNAVGRVNVAGSIFLHRSGELTEGSTDDEAVLTRAEIEAMHKHSIYSEHPGQTQRIDGNGSVWQLNGTLAAYGSGASYNGPDGALRSMYFDTAWYEDTGEVYYTNTVWMLFMQPTPYIHWVLSKIDDPAWGAFISDSIMIPTDTLYHNTGFALGTVTLDYVASGGTYYRIGTLAFESRLNAYTTLEYHSAATAATETRLTNDIAVAVALATNAITPSKIGALATADAPALTNGLASEAFARSLAPTGVPFWYEFGNSNFFATLESGTGYVWRVTAVASRYTVTFSADARTQSDNVYPPAAELAFPFTNGLWSGYVLSGLTNDVLYLNGSGTARWRGVGTTYPLTLVASLNALGTAVVSNYPFHFSTNLYTRLADTNELARYLTLDDYVAGTNLLSDQMQAIANNAANAYAWTNRTITINGVTGSLATNNSFTVAGDGGAETDPVAGPLVALLEGRTNDWNAAFLWGNHALGGYLPATSTNGWETGAHLAWLLPGATNGLASEAYVTSALSAVATPTGVPFWTDLVGGYFATLESGSPYVWKVTPVVTSYRTDFSDNFEAGFFDANYPTNGTPWPFTNGNWSAYTLYGITNIIYHAAFTSSIWISTNPAYPRVLVPFSNAYGTATVSEVYGGLLVTNVYTRLASTNDIAAFATLADYIAGTNAISIRLLATEGVANAALPKVATNGWEWGAHQVWLLPSATSSLATAASVIAATGSLANVSYVIAATSGLATAASVVSATGGLVNAAYVISATTGLATAANVIAATNGLVNVSDLALVTNSTGSAVFGYVTASGITLGTLSITNSTLNGTNGVRLNWGSITNYWILGGH